MPDLELPQLHLEGITLLAKLDEPQFLHFMQTLKDAKPFTDRKHLISNASAAAPEGLADSYAKIASTAIAMKSFCTYAEVPTKVFAADVFASSSVNSLALGENKDPTKARLVQLLTTESIIVAAKATANLTAHEHPFRNVRVFTDVRTVFIDEEEKIEEISPAAAVIVQMMRIRYIKNGNQEEIFFALDTIDIDNMMATLQRAKTKHERLKVLLAKASLPCVEIASDDEEY